MNFGRRTDTLVVAMLVAMFLGVFMVLRLRTPPPSDSPAVRPPPHGDDLRQGEASGKVASEAKDATGDAASAAPIQSSGLRETKAPVEETEDGVAGHEKWVHRAPVEFTEEDLAECGAGVDVGLGRYNTRKGEEFEVAVSLKGPALASCTIVVDYDTDMLEVVPRTAEPVGRQFRGGIECYADEAGGRLILIQEGVPGKKNLDRSSGDHMSAVWRMRALRSGRTRLQVADETSFTNGRGEEEGYRVVGGDIVIR